MSLINCPECNNMVSDKATACPNCGISIYTKLDAAKISIGNAAGIAAKVIPITLSLFGRIIYTSTCAILSSILILLILTLLYVFYMEFTDKLLEFDITIVLLWPVSVVLLFIYFWRNPYKIGYLNHMNEESSADLNLSEIKLINFVNPKFPSNLANKNYIGSVSARVTLNSSGKITRKSIDKSNHPLFAAEVLKVLDAWEFEYTSVGENTLDKIIIISFTFENGKGRAVKYDDIIWRSSST